METYYTGICSNGHFIKVTFADTYTERSNPKRLVAKCNCGSTQYVKRMDQELTETKCGGRCTQATNSKCHCSCGGENHGASRINF